jgi:dTDP-4-amino-4,6-dideoxygalactose transaminase
LKPPAAAETAAFDPHRLDKSLLSRPAGAPPRGAAAEFEAKLALRAGRRFCLLTGSGRDALKLAMTAAGAAGGTIGMTDLTHPSAPEAADWCGADKSFIGINRRSLNLDDAALLAALRRIDVLLVTHMFSASCDIARAEKTCAEAGIPLIEDASQIIGESASGRPYGSFGDISVLSLSPYKPVSCPGVKAGAVLCDDKALFGRIKAAAAGFDRPSARTAAYLCLKLKNLDSTLAGLGRINAAYARSLSGLDGLSLAGAGPRAHEFPVLARKRSALEKALRAAGIPLERVYEPFSLAHGVGGTCRACARYAAQAIHLPVYPMMTACETAYVIKHVRKFYGH